MKGLLYASSISSPRQWSLFLRTWLLQVDVGAEIGDWRLYEGACTASHSSRFVRLLLELSRKWKAQFIDGHRLIKLGLS